MNIDNALMACQKLLGEKVINIETPGGKTRKSVRAQLKDRSVIVTHRKSAGRARLEAEVIKRLRAINSASSIVPELLAFDGSWLIQEDLGDRRLSQALASSTPEEAKIWLKEACKSLSLIHEAGRLSGLDTLVPPIGTKPGWLENLIAVPNMLSPHFNLPPPQLNTSSLLDRLQPSKLHFVKWDARPANAIARPDGSVAWFDWEHCGCRHPLDDLAWLLGDEYSPEDPSFESHFLSPHITALKSDEDPSLNESYLATFGTLHMCLRLTLIMSEKNGGPWWDWEYCLRRDKVGVNQSASIRMARRAAKWAEHAPELHSLVPWLNMITERLLSLK